MLPVYEIYSACLFIYTDSTDTSSIASLQKLWSPYRKAEGHVWLNPVAEIADGIIVELIAWHYDSDSEELVSG